MAKPERPVATSRSTLAAVRQSQARRVRSAVRTQLADSQRRRRELSQALLALQRGLREFRDEVRMRLRGMSRESAVRKTVTAPGVAPPIISREPR